jgi:hypothetical protein
MKPNIDKLMSAETVLFRFANNDLRVKLARRWGIKIGSNCKLFSGNFGSEPYLITLGNHCEITHGVQFIRTMVESGFFEKIKSFWDLNLDRL